MTEGCKDPTRALHLLLEAWVKKEGACHLQAPSFVFKSRRLFESGACPGRIPCVAVSVARGLSLRSDIQPQEVHEVLRIFHIRGVDFSERGLDGRAAAEILLNAPPGPMNSRDVAQLLESFGIKTQDRGLHDQYPSGFLCKFFCKGKKQNLPPATLPRAIVIKDGKRKGPKEGSRP